MSRGHSTPQLTQPRKKCFKTTLPDALQAVRDAHPDVQLEQWTMDEHRIGLKPIIRRVWRRKGRRPLVTVHYRYKWMYLYGFVCPSSGQTFWLVLPSVSVRAYTLALKDFADAVGAGAGKHVAQPLLSGAVHLDDGMIIASNGSVFTVLYSDSFTPEEMMDLEIGVVLSAERVKPLRIADDVTLAVHELPAVEQMATIVHGGMDDHPTTYNALGRWLEQHHYRIVGPGRDGVGA